MEHAPDGRGPKGKPIALDMIPDAAVAAALPLR